MIPALPHVFCFVNMFIAGQRQKKLFIMWRYKDICKKKLSQGKLNQAHVANNDMPKTAFRTKFGAYESVVVNFGVTNPPLTFATLINSVFWPLIVKSVVIYINNIIVFSRPKAQHKSDLRDVFNNLCENQLYTKPSKCQFYEKSLMFLGRSLAPV